MSNIKKTDPIIIDELVDFTCFDKNICKLLYLRGLNTPEKVKAHVKRSKVTDSSKLSQMKESVDRIVQAIENKEKIVICGDYDVDGTVSTAIMYRFFKELGYPVEYYIPHRIEEGYGISAIGVEKLVKEGAQLLISVDNGIAAFDAADKARELGIDLIITDHHDLIDNKIPEAFTVVNPKKDTIEECRYLSGAGVAFYLINEVNRRFENKVDLRKHLVLCAIASVADVVPLTLDNRILVKKGIELFKDHAIIGLMNLAKSLGMYINQLTAQDVGYKLGPILNAAGRLEGADKTIQLLIEEDEEKIEELIGQLKAINSARRQLTEDATKLLMERVNPDHSVIVVSGTHHQGISGIVASRIKDEFNKPVIVISFDTGNKGKASARSVNGFNIKDAIAQSPHHLGGGGHYMAAGFSIEKDQLDDFTNQINEYAKGKVGLQEKEIDLSLKSEDLSDSFAKQLESLEPFGAKFEYPSVRYEGKITMRRLLKDEHIMLTLDNKVTVFLFFRRDMINYPMGARVVIEGDLMASKGKFKIIGS